jgi:two-component system, cell cycle sensor histidine kinase and response regulator CckA
MRPVAPASSAAFHTSADLFVRVASGVLIAVGLTVLVGWFLDIDGVKSLAPGTSTMKANTSLLFALGGVATWLAANRRATPLVRGFAFTMITVAILTLGQYLSGRDFGLDQLLVRDGAPVPPTAAPGRMGINTAVSFACAGTALLCVHSRRKRVRRLAQALAMVSSGLGAVALTGYAYSVQASYSLTSYTQMAPHTALLATLLGLGIVFVNAGEGIAGVITSAGPGGAMTRTLLPFVILGPFVLGWLRLEGQHLGLYGTEFGVAILVIVSTSSLAAVVMLYASRIDRADALTRLAEEDARDADERFRLAVSAARIGACEMELATERITCSDVFMDMLGLPPGSPPPTAERFLAMVHPDDRPALVAAQSRLPPADNESLEFRVVWPDGSIHWLYMRTHTSLRADGKPERLLAAAIDITDRKALEAELRQAQKLEAVGQLAGGVAHDFNNVLTAVIGYSDLLLTEAPPGTTLQDGLSEIRKAGQRASQITRQLLAFSRKQILQPRVLDVNPVIADLAKMLGRVVYEHVTIVTRLDPEVGRIRADPTQFEQVLVNLAVNARDAMPKGGTLTIETANVTIDEPHGTHRETPAVTPGAYVVLSVSDTGAGMDAATQARLFEPFFTTKELGKGTGLGLATVYGIVTQSGGYISVHSEPGRGSTFKIYLPRVDEMATVDDAPLDAPVARGQMETVLLVEDEPAVRQLAHRVLAGAGYRVLDAGTPQEALAVARASTAPIDLLLSDVVMPGGGDVSLFEELARERTALRVLYMSGYADEAMVQRGWLSNGAPYLQKPFTAHELTQKVRDVLDR